MCACWDVVEFQWLFEANGQWVASELSVLSSKFAESKHYEPRRCMYACVCGISGIWRPNEIVYVLWRLGGCGGCGWFSIKVCILIFVFLFWGNFSKIFYVEFFLWGVGWSVLHHSVTSSYSSITHPTAPSQLHKFKTCKANSIMIASSNLCELFSFFLFRT